MPQERKNMEVVLDWSEGGNALREGFIEEITFEMDLEGLVWFKHVELGRRWALKTEGIS